MYSIEIDISERCGGFFALSVLGHQAGRIDILLHGSELILTHTTIILKKYQDLIAKKLIREVVEYAKMHELKIITISKFVQMQFSKCPAKYADVWEKA